jgi:hypothetical protein
MDPDPWRFFIRIRFRILLFSSVVFSRCQQKVIFFKDFSYYLLHQFSKVKSHKTAEIKVFLIFFCLLVEGFGSGKHRNFRIQRIRIRIAATYIYKNIKYLFIWYGNPTNSHCYRRIPISSICETQRKKNLRNPTNQKPIAKIEVKRSIILLWFTAI